MNNNANSLSKYDFLGVLEKICITCSWRELILVFSKWIAEWRRRCGWPWGAKPMSVPYCDSWLNLTPYSPKSSLASIKSPSHPKSLKSRKTWNFLNFRFFYSQRMTGTTEIRHRTQTENDTEKMNNNHQQTIEDIRRETRLLTYREQDRINIFH